MPILPHLPEILNMFLSVGSLYLAYKSISGQEVATSELVALGTGYAVVLGLNQSLKESMQERPVSRNLENAVAVQYNVEER